MLVLESFRAPVPSIHKMNKVVVPKRSGVHRFACLALYRALLRQCSPSSDSPQWLYETRSLVRQRFRRYKDLQSPSQVANALKAGYKTLDLLDSATSGNQRDAQQLTTILSQAKSVKEQCVSLQKERAAELERLKPPLSKKQAQKNEISRFHEATRRRHPDTPSILNYSQRQVNGKRRIPVLVNARGLPFLRIKKPQPLNLSGVLRGRLEKRWHRIERRDRLHAELLFAKDEDVWDGLTNDTEQCTWSEEVKRSLDDTYAIVRESDRKTRELAESMWKIVLREREKAKEQEDRHQAVD